MGPRRLVATGSVKLKLKLKLLLCSSLWLVTTCGSLWLVTACGSQSRSISDAGHPPPPIAPPTVATPSANPPVVKPAPLAKPANAAPPAAYNRALDKADSAENLSQTARSADDWNLITLQWHQAAQLMQSIPPSDPYHQRAQQKFGTYQRNWTAAKNRAANPQTASLDTRPLSQGPGRTAIAGSALTVGGEPTPTAATPQVFQAPIKRRASGTPVIDVTFNGSQTFEMVVDTGASSTVLTKAMATTLGLSATGKAQVNTASDRGVEVSLVHLDSIAVGGAQIKDVMVAIGGDALEIGLLGHDFFANYDITVKRDIVEFRVRS